MKPFIFIFTLLFSLVAQSATDVLRRNIKLPSQEVLHRLDVLAPLAADANAILDGVAQGASATVVTTFLAQPDVARNLVLTTGGTTADIKAGDVVITGIGVNGQAISETFALTDNLNGAVTGNKAFLRVDSVSIPVGDTPFGGTLDLGFGTKLGLTRCMDGAGFFIKGLVDNVVLTGDTVAASATALESNTVIPNPAPDGTRNFTFLFVQNYRCGE